MTTEMSSIFITCVGKTLQTLDFAETEKEHQINIFSYPLGAIN